MKRETFHETLRKKVDAHAHLVYRLTRKFPPEERYGITSQLRRAALSVALNYIEGSARGGKTASNRNFIEISYGSLKEVEYLLSFCLQENLLTALEYDEASMLNHEIGAMLWGILRNLRHVTRFPS